MSGSKGGGSKAPAMPTPEQLKPLLELQARYNRVGTQTPFGSQTYRTNPDGSSTLVTDIGEDGRAMINRAGGLAMTDSARVASNPALDGITGALAGRVGSRLGVNVGSAPMSLVSQPQRAQKPAQAQPPALPPPSNPEPPVDPYGEDWREQNRRALEMDRQNRLNGWRR